MCTAGKPQHTVITTLCVRCSAVMHGIACGGDKRVAAAPGPLGEHGRCFQLDVGARADRQQHHGEEGVEVKQR